MHANPGTNPGSVRASCRDAVHQRDADVNPDLFLFHHHAPAGYCGRSTRQLAIGRTRYGMPEPAGMESRLP